MLTSTTLSPGERRVYSGQTGFVVKKEERRMEEGQRKFTAVGEHPRPETNAEVGLSS